MAEHEPHVIGISSAQDLQRAARLSAAGAFEVAILDQRDRRVKRAADVIGSVDDLDEILSSVGVHDAVTLEMSASQSLAQLP